MTLIRSDDDSDDDSEALEQEETDDLDSIASEDSETLPVETSTKTLGERMMALWVHRRKKLVYDLSITAWMVSPMEDIMKDVQDKHHGHHRTAVERLIRKWYQHEVNNN